MSKRLSLTFMAILLSISVFATGNYKAWWAKGNEYYQQKNYDSAAFYFSQIADLQPGNAEVYYNLGNTYYKLNSIGKAVLNYERALKYNPSHKQATDNLYLTQGRIKNRIQPMPEIFFIRWWNGITQSNLTNIYAGIAVFLFLLFIGYRIVRRLGIFQYEAPIQLSAAIIALCSLFVILSIVSARNMTSSRAAVVMQEGAPMMREPKYGKSMSLIPEGIKVHINEQKGNWYEVALPDGRTGWLQESAIEKI